MLQVLPADSFVLRKTNFLGLGVVAKLRHHRTTCPLPSTFSQLMNVDRLHGLLEFLADPFLTKKYTLTFGLVAKRRHHHTASPPPSTFRQLMCVDMLQVLPEFKADPLVLRKTNFLGFGCGCKKVPSPDNGSIAKHIQPIDERGQAAGSPELWG
jgi:hypothetical protein